MPLSMYASLRREMMRCFEETDLIEICMDLNISFTDLNGHSRKDKVRSLIVYCNKLGRIPDLVTICPEVNPDFAWQAPDDFIEQVTHLHTKASRLTYPQASSTIPTQPDKQQAFNRLLRQMMVTYLTEKQVRKICSDLGINFEDLPGNDRRRKILELLNYCRRRGFIRSLHQLCVALYPAEDWPQT